MVKNSRAGPSMPDGVLSSFVAVSFPQPATRQAARRSRSTIGRETVALRIGQFPFMNQLEPGFQ